MGDTTNDASKSSIKETKDTITYRQYKDETDLPVIMALVDNTLSEPYSIFTYRYFLRLWPHLCYMSYDSKGTCFGVVIAKMDSHKQKAMRGYIAMLVVAEGYRHLGIGSELVSKTIKSMIEDGCEEVVLEAEESNKGALRLYEKLGFLRDKRLQRYYLNGSDAFRLKLKLPAPDKTPDKGSIDPEMEQVAHTLQQLSVGAA